MTSIGYVLDAKILMQKTPPLNLYELWHRSQPRNNFQATHNGENFNHNTRLVPWITPAQTKKKKDHYTNRNNTSTIKI